MASLVEKSLNLNVFVYDSIDIEPYFLKETLLSWITKSNEKWGQCDFKDPAYDIFLSAKVVSIALIKKIKEGAKVAFADCRFNVFVCEDEKKTIQAIAIGNFIKESGNYSISAIVTNPINIKSPLNDEESGRVRYAASKIVKFVIQTAFFLGKTFEKIEVESLDSSRCFWKNLDFVNVPSISGESSSFIFCITKNK